MEIHPLCHHRPGGTAGGSHKRQFLRHFADEVLSLLRSTQIRADGNLKNIGKAKFAHGSTQLTGSHLGTKLSDKSGCNGGIYFLARLNSADDLEDLRLVRNSAKRTVYQTHTAGNAAIVIDLCLAIGIAVNGVDAAGHGTGTFLLDDGVIAADFGTAAALNTFCRINVRTAIVAIQRDGTLWTDLYTGMGKAALTSFGHQVTLFYAPITGEFDDVDQRRRIVGLRLISCLDIVRDRRMLSSSAAGQAHRQTQTLANNSPL